MSQEAESHCNGFVVKPECKHHQAAAFKCVSHYIDEPRTVARPAAERGTLLAFPAAHFQCDELVKPGLHVFNGIERIECDSALLRESPLLAPPFVPMMRGADRLDVLLGVSLWLEHGAFPNVDDRIVAPVLP